MAETMFNTRIIHKHDTEANWAKTTNFVPKQGELIIYDPDSNYSYPRLKMGNGSANVNKLPFIDDTKADKTTLATLQDQVDLIEKYRLLGDYTFLKEFQRGNVNLFPKDCIWKAPGFIDPNGTVSAYLNPAYICTESFIPITAGYPFFLFYDGIRKNIYHFAYYDINKDFLSHTKTASQMILPPEGAHYIRFSLLVADFGIANGEQSIDENGHLVIPSGKIELFQQTGTAYNPGEYVTLEVFDKENFFIQGELIDDGSISLAKCDFVTKYPCINCWDPEDVQSGYNGPADGYGNFGSNEVYNCTQPFIVAPGQKLSFWRLNSLAGSSATSIDARFVSFYDYAGNLISNFTYIHNVEVPENATTAMVTIYLPSLNDDVRLGYIQRHNNVDEYQGYYEPMQDIYKIDNTVISDLQQTEVHLHLPPEICVPSGSTIELYNSQCCLEADKYYLQWIGKYGSAYDWKYVLEGSDELVGTSFTLTLNIYNEALQYIDSVTTTVKFVSNILTNDQLIIPIGDSLTNQKPWLNTIYSTLSSNKIAFRGTRGTTNPALVNGITHEGRSGAAANWYNVGTSTYTFDSNGLSTLPDITTNPFWNTTTNAFDFDYYCNSAADGGAGYFQDTNGNTISLTPTGVMIFLGANGASLDPTTTVESITTLISLIRNSTKGVTIPIYVVNTQFRAPYILSTTADGFATNQTGEYKFQNDLKYFRLMRALNNALLQSENVYIVPIATTFDSAHNYPYTEVNVNPYNDTLKIRKYTDTIHPMSATYDQMAATMFGSICAHSEAES